jgi:nucleoside triphosphatase
LRSRKWLGKYVIPGGRIELGETIDAALRREIKEETNLDIYDIEFLCVQEFIFLDYACRTDYCDVILDSEGQEYVWVTLDKALDLPVDSYTSNTINTYISKHGKGACDKS